MSSILSWLQKHLVWSIPGAMLLGLTYGRWADGSALRWAVMPLTFLMVYPMMVALNLRALASRGGGGLVGGAIEACQFAPGLEVSPSTPC